jgi:spore coat protein U-like protein
MKRNRLLVTAAAVVAIVGVAIVATPRLHAATATANLSVSASVSANCLITAGTLAFGAYDPVFTNASTDLTGSGTFTVACTKNASGVWIGMGLGLNAGAGTVRKMRVGATANYLDYELYQEVARTNVWGNTQLTGVSYVPTSKAPATITVYGTVPQNQDVEVGSYTDTVVMTVNF